MFIDYRRDIGIAIFIVFATAIANWLFPYYYAAQPANQSFGADFESFGGPVSYDLPTGYQDGLDNPDSADLDNSALNTEILEGSLILSITNLLGNVTPSRDGIILYKTKEGDNLSSIASEFGVSLNTILWTNVHLNSSDSLQVGQEIVILPVSGVLHRVKEGETPDSIAALYGILSDKISELNKNVKYEPGEAVIVPGAKPLKQFFAASLPNVLNYFILPAEGRNWGILHRNNAVDIANTRGTSVLAAAEGLVEEARTGWNRGYGTYILLKHVYNGIDELYTLYAHLDKAVVSKGDYVFQGTKIGEMGNTGNAHGPTGYHLHFEVHGAKNPFSFTL